MSRYDHDYWWRSSNDHMLGYVLRRLSANSRAWGEPNSPVQRTATQIAVRYKNAWATDMHEWGTDPTTGEVRIPTPEEQKAAWEECMVRAESEIATLFAKAAA